MKTQFTLLALRLCLTQFQNYICLSALMNFWENSLLYYLKPLQALVQGPMHMVHSLLLINIYNNLIIYYTGCIFLAIKIDIENILPSASMVSYLLSLIGSIKGDIEIWSYQNDEWPFLLTPRSQLRQFWINNFDLCSWHHFLFDVSYLR